MIGQSYQALACIPFAMSAFACNTGQEACRDITTCGPLACAVLNLVIAQHAIKHSSRNTRAMVISLELFPVINWIAALLSPVPLDIDYSEFCVPFNYISKARMFDSAVEHYLVLQDQVYTINRVATAAATVCLQSRCIPCLAVCYIRTVTAIAAAKGSAESTTTFPKFCLRDAYANAVSQPRFKARALGWMHHLCGIIES